MPLLITQYTYPSFVTNSCKLYSLIILSGMSVILSLMYSLHFIGVFKEKSLMSSMINLAPGVEMMLFAKHSKSVMSALGILCCLGS